MNFKSQISTTRKQSQRLLALGLKPETADMVYHHTNSKSPIFEWELHPHPPVLRGDIWTPERINKLATILHKHPDGTPKTGEEVFYHNHAKQAVSNTIESVIGYCQWRGIDLEWHIEQKMRYNELRSHKHGGKRY